VVTQPQVVLVKQFQPPKFYTGASSWQGYRECFERLATVNGWSTTEQKTEQLALALEDPASEVLRDLDTFQPQPSLSDRRAWGCSLESTTATLCCTALYPAPFRSCSESRTTRRVSFCKCLDGQMSTRCFRRCTGCLLNSA